MSKKKNSLFAELLSFVLLMFVLYCAGVGALYLGQRFLIYHPDRNTPTPPENAQITSVVTHDNVWINGWWFKPRYKRNPAILFLHGNAGNIEHRQHKIKAFLKAGYGVLLAEYRGYGGNDGYTNINEKSLYMDGEAYLRWLQDYKVKDIIIYGESIGSGVAVELASKYKVKALILETPFASLADAARHHYKFIPFLDFFMKDKYDNISKIGNVDAPKLFLIAGRDEVVGWPTSVKLAKAAPDPKAIKVYKNSGHNTIYQTGVETDILAFLASIGSQTE
ncbi:MAG: alpha/beta hydrolase [Micavibrio sp.]|nr:alpha/beta hydrolase [Micavibrio sp.]